MSDPCAHFDCEGRCENGRRNRRECNSRCADYDDGIHLEAVSFDAMNSRAKLWQEVTHEEDSEWT